jgi:hypothetical protein
MRLLILVIFSAFGLGVQGQPSAIGEVPPVTKADAGRWDAAIVQRAAALLASAAMWNRADTGTCPRGAAALSVRCALEKAVDEATQTPAGTADCRLHTAGQSQEGSCGLVFDEAQIFTIARAKAVTTGRWRTDLEPDQVWAGAMIDAAAPVMDEAHALATRALTARWPDPLSDFNNDPARTFADVQAFFRDLGAHVLTRAEADLTGEGDEVEIEVYPGGTGVMRTYAGWFPISTFVARDSALTFQLDSAHQVPPNDLDRAILERADALIASEAVWNRADDRKCPASETTWSIYCAEERASIDVTGGFHHRRPALELVREIVDERSKSRPYKHRLMEYNNDPSTRLTDVRSLFAEAIARIK